MHTILITGANSGLGFALAQRLVDRCIQERQEMQLIVTCRSEAKALETIERLCQRRSVRNLMLLRLSYVILDMTSMESVQACADTLRSRHKRIDVAYFNAGTWTVERIDYAAAVREFFQRGLMTTMTLPEFYVERVGETTADGLGYLFQVNFFAQYYLRHELEPLLKGNRVVITTSLTSTDSFDADDWQCLQGPKPYETSKCVTSAVYAEEYAKQPYTELLVQPGLFRSGMWDKGIANVMALVALLVFYLVRLAGSPWHNMTAKSAAMAFEWAGLDATEGSQHEGVCWGTATTRLGRPYVRYTAETVRTANSATVYAKAQDLLREWQQKLHKQQPPA